MPNKYIKKYPEITYRGISRISLPAMQILLSFKYNYFYEINTDSQRFFVTKGYRLLTNL